MKEAVVFVDVTRNKRSRNIYELKRLIQLVHVIYKSCSIHQKIYRLNHECLLDYLMSQGFLLTLPAEGLNAALLLAMSFVLAFLFSYRGSCSAHSISCH